MYNSGVYTRVYLRVVGMYTWVSLRVVGMYTRVYLRVEERPMYTPGYTSGLIREEWYTPGYTSPVSLLG